MRVPHMTRAIACHGEHFGKNDFSGGARGPPPDLSLGGLADPLDHLLGHLSGAFGQVIEARFECCHALADRTQIGCQRAQFGRHLVVNGELSPIKTVQVKQDSNGEPLG